MEWNKLDSEIRNAEIRNIGFLSKNASKFHKTHMK